MAALAKLSDLRLKLGFTGTDKDTLLTQLLERVSSLAAQMSGRESLLRIASRTEFPSDIDGQSRYVKLAVWPIESVTSVKQLYATGTDAEFAAATGLTENSDFVVNHRTGKLERINSVWFLRTRCLQVIYTGGYIDPSEESPPEGSHQPPEWLQLAIIEQCIQMFNTADTAGVQEITTPDGGRLTNLPAKPHPLFIEACKKLRRFSL